MSKIHQGKRERKRKRDEREYRERERESVVTFGVVDILLPEGSLSL